MKPEYPIRKFDYLNRLVYADWNGYERVAKTYWGETNSVKVRYTYFGKDISIDAYDENGEKLMTMTNTSFTINMGGIKMDEKGIVQFNVDKNILNMWKEKYKFKPIEKKPPPTIQWKSMGWQNGPNFY